MDEASQTYYQRRERAERAAAKRAASAEARRVHHQLAMNYAALVQNPGEWKLPLEHAWATSRLTILPGDRLA
jgi:hypothetical protein